ncbi:MAG: trimethylamine methyltransferase family protein [Spirochaetales bacterium]|nr:trimethylamine methyltransferase family protein [Spirochaetales bacterium]
MFSKNELKEIDEAARSLLKDPGIKVDDEGIAAKLLKHGAKEGRSSGVIRFPDKMVSDFISIAPSEFLMANRTDKGKQISPGASSAFWTGAALFYLDKNGFREISNKDLADFTRVIDNLSNVDAIVGTSIKDEQPVHRDFVGFKIMAENTKKHIRVLSFTPKGSEAVIEMAQVLSGGKSIKENPIFSIGFTAHGPLRWTSLALGVYKTTAGYGIPCTVNGEPMAGASSPVTLAGTLAVGTAEILSGIIINQILEEGRPCFFNLGFAHVMDMRSGFAVTGGPENVLLAVAGAELARYYNLPSVSWMCSDSLYYDSQNSLEKMLAALEHYKANVSVVWGVGQLESEKTISPVQAVIDDEIIGIVKKYSKGIKVDKENIALEEIRKVGIQGDFLATDHTFKHFRGAIYEPGFLIRKQRFQDGSQVRLVTKAEDYVDSLINNKKDYKNYISETQLKEIEKIEKEYKKLITTF